MAYNNETEKLVEIHETVDGAVAAETVSRNVKGRAPRFVKGRPDTYIWGIYVLFLIISIVELYSASSSEVAGSNVYLPLIRHSIFLGAGLGIVLWFQNIHYGYFTKFAGLITIISLGLLVASTFMGVEINGAQRAIKIAGLTIQPPEIVKLAVVIQLAAILGRCQRPGGVTWTGVALSAGIVVVYGALLWINGLTNTILLMGISASMFLIGGIQWSRLLAVAAIYMVGIGVLYLVKYSDKGGDEFDQVAQTEQVASANDGKVALGGRADTHEGRMKRFFKGVKPTDPIDDLNRQVVFSNFAQAHGGVFGQGPGNSRESARLPLAFSDYIYSIIIEDTGLIGGAALLLLYLALVARAGRIAYKCSRAVPAFLIMGCAVMIVFQALFHMAIVTGLFPVSGQPLPFISKGGTSVLVMSAAIGIMLSVSRFAVTSGKRKDIDAESRALPENMQAANFSAGDGK